MEKEIEQILENLNKSFEPITDEIDEKLGYLQSLIHDERDLSFKAITKDEITEE